MTCIHLWPAAGFSPREPSTSNVGPDTRTGRSGAELLICRSPALDVHITATRGARNAITFRPAWLPISCRGSGAKSSGASRTLSVADLEKDLVDHDRILIRLYDVLDAPKSLLQELGGIGIEEDRSDPRRGRRRERLKSGPPRSFRYAPHPQEPGSGTSPPPSRPQVSRVWLRRAQRMVPFTALAV